jgi:hypothetical protein
VNSKFQLSLRVFLVAALVALGVWKWIPGTTLDRTAFAAVASGSANGTLFISGSGSREEPWKLRTFTSDRKPDSRQAPVIVSLGDDPRGFFQSSPPAPIDLAVIFSNFQRLGAKKAASAAVLAWEKPDAIGLAALEKSLSRFDSLVMAAPLSRGVVSSPMPPAFRRTSIPLDKIHGDASALPLVNRLPLPGIILGGDATIVGFSVLESETPSRFLPLMARWEDRVVFSFALLTVLQRLDLPLEGVEVRLGEFLKLSPAGPIVRVDESGRFEMPLRPISGYAEISAEALIDGGDDLFPKQAPDPVILRDDKSATEPATQAFSKNLSVTIAALASAGGLSEIREFPRLPEGWEIGLLSLLVLILTALVSVSGFTRKIVIVIMATACFAAQWIGLGLASVWLPVLPMLAAIISASMVIKLTAKPETESPAIAEPMPEPMPEPVEIPAPAEAPLVTEVKAKPPAKKAAAKKVAAKKVAAKKVPAKKAASRRKPNDESE